MGQSKEQLKAIIDLLPSHGHIQTVDVKPQSQRQELMPQQQQSAFDLGAMFQQLTE
jgi:hypothetical protein